MLKPKFKLALLQRTDLGSPSANLEECERQLRAAAAQGANLAVLPELHSGAYFCQHEDPAEFDAAEPVPGPTTERLGNIAGELGLVIVGSLFERRASGVYHNTAVVLDTDGHLAGLYRKMHIPDDPGYYEKFYFAPGDSGFTPIPTRVGQLGVMVCWDQWFPEAARLMALAGAEILIYPTAIGWDPCDDRSIQMRQLDAWQTVQRGHAIANGLPLAACNRVGYEGAPNGVGGIDFWGSSFVCGPQGEILAQTGATSSALVLAEIDPLRTEATRRIWPFLRDRRIDAYQDLVLRFRDGRPTPRG